MQKCNKSFLNYSLFYEQMEILTKIQTNYLSFHLLSLLDFEQKEKTKQEINVIQNRKTHFHNNQIFVFFTYKQNTQNNQSKNYRMGRKKDKKDEIDKRKEERKKDMQIKKKLRQKMSKGDKFKQSNQYIEYAAKFNKQILVLRVKIRDVGGDGNCLFRAFADQVDGSEQTHKFMRQQACRYMTDNEEFFKPFLDEDEDGPFDKYIKQMLKEGQWGGHLQIQALCECFKCIVVIHKTGLQEIVMRPMINDPTFGVIHLGYFQHEDFEHYVSIRQNEDESQLPGIEKLKFLNKNMYEHLLYQDEEEYMIQKQLQEMQIIQKLQNQWNYFEDKKDVYIEQPQPYPGYPRNKKCKCGSKLPYKNCCLKEFQKKTHNKFSSS